MSKGLEALKRIRQETCPATYNNDFDKNECCDIIEKELKRLEKIDKSSLTDEDVIFLQNNIKNIRREENKKLKALEIIKKKRVNVGLLLRCATVERYNKGICYEPKHLTPEEYDLLKEVLL